MLSDPPDKATAILCERETPRSLKAEAKRCSKPELHRLKPGDCMHRGDGTPVLTYGLDTGQRKRELAVYLLLGYMHVRRQTCQTSNALMSDVDFVPIIRCHPIYGKF